MFGGHYRLGLAGGEHVNDTVRPAAGLALSGIYDGVDDFNQALAPLIEQIKSTSVDKGFKRTLVDDLGVDPGSEVGKIVERAVAADFDDMFGDVPADAFYCTERIKNAAVAHREIDL